MTFAFSSNKYVLKQVHVIDLVIVITRSHDCKYRSGIIKIHKSKEEFSETYRLQDQINRKTPEINPISKVSIADVATSHTNFCTYLNILLIFKVLTVSFNLISKYSHAK